jgi:hypothetical protein
MWGPLSRTDGCSGITTTAVEVNVGNKWRDKSDKEKTCAKMWKNGPKRCELISASFYLRNKYLCSKTVSTPKPLPFVNLTFPKIENFAHRGLFSVNWRNPFKKYHCYLKQSHKITSRGALNYIKLEWSSG